MDRATGGGGMVAPGASSSAAAMAVRDDIDSSDDDYDELVLSRQALPPAATPAAASAEGASDAAAPGRNARPAEHDTARSAPAERPAGGDDGSTSARGKANTEREETTSATGTAADGNGNDDLRQEVLSRVRSVVRACLVRLKAGDLAGDGLERACYGRLLRSSTKSRTRDDDDGEEFSKFLGVVADGLVKEMTGDTDADETLGGKRKLKKKMKKRLLKLLKSNVESVEREIQNDGGRNGAAAAEQRAGNGTQAAGEGGCDDGERTQAVGEAAVSALRRGLSEDGAVEEVTDVAVGLFGTLERGGAEKVARAAVTGAMASGVTRAEAGRTSGPDGATSATASTEPSVPATASAPADSAAATPSATPAPSAPSVPATASAPADSAAATPSATPAPSAPPALPHAQLPGGDDVSKPATKPSASALVAAAPAPPPTAAAAPTSSSLVASAPSKSTTQTDEPSSPGEKKRKKRVAFLNKVILAGPELYDHSKRFSKSGLRIPTDQAVAVVQRDDPSSATVMKIRGVITGAPRPKFDKDWFDVKWSVEDEAVLQTLDTKIPATARHREWLTLAMEATKEAGRDDEAGEEAGESSQQSKEAARMAQDVVTTKVSPTADAQETAKDVSKIERAATEEAGNEEGESSQDSSQLKSKDNAHTAQDFAAKVYSGPRADTLTSKDTSKSDDAPVDETDKEADESSQDSAQQSKVAAHTAQDAGEKAPLGPRADPLGTSKDVSKIDDGLNGGTKKSNKSASEQAGAPKHVDRTNGAEQAEESTKKSAPAYGSSKDSPNEFESYAKSGRPSLPADTKMNSNLLSLFLFDVHVIPMLMKAGWTMSKKKRVLNDPSDVDAPSSLHFDHLFVPPGVKARSPFKKRVDYFDSRKQFMACLASDKFKDDELSKYALAFYDAVSRIAKEQKRSKGKETFDEMAERIISRADKEAHNASKRAPSASSGSTRQEKSSKLREKAGSPPSSDDEVLSDLRTKKKKTAREGTKAEAKRPTESSSSDEEVLSALRSKKKTKKTVAGIKEKAKRPRPVATCGESSSSEEEPISAPRIQKKKAGAAKQRPRPVATSGESSSSEEVPIAAPRTQKKKACFAIASPTESSSSSDEEVLANFRTKKEEKLPQDSTQAAPLPERASANSKDCKRGFSATRPFPRYVKGTSVEIFPSEDAIRQQIVIPIIKEYRDSAPSNTPIRSDGTPLQDDDILRVVVTSIPGDPDHVNFVANGLEELQSKLKTYTENYIDKLETKSKEEIKEPKTHPTVNAKFPVGTVVKKFFPGHGLFKGTVAALPSKGHEYYRVIYSDGDEEDIAMNELFHYTLDVVDEKKDDGRGENETAKISTVARDKAEKAKISTVARDKAEKIFKIPKKKKREIAETKPSADVTQMTSETQTIPKKKRRVEQAESLIIPLRATTESALTQRINKRRRMEAPTMMTKRAPSTSGTLAATPRSTQQREYQVVFNPKEPLGFFVVTKNRSSGTVCQITSVSPLTSKKDARLKPGTIVVAAGRQREALSSHIELRRKYEEAAREGSGSTGQMPLWFINTEVVASNESNAQRKKSDWSSSGAWQGFSGAQGWPGGAKFVQQLQDQEGARQLKQWRRHIPSVHRWGGVGGRALGAIPSSLGSIANPYNAGWVPPRMPRDFQGTTNRSQGPQPSILRKKGKSTAKRSVRFNEMQLCTKHLFSKSDDRVMREPEADTSGGLKPVGNDALSYAVLHKDYRAVVQLLEDGAYAYQVDSNRKKPMDYIHETSHNLSRERQNLKMHSSDSEAMKKVDASIRDLELKKKAMKIFMEAERVVEMACYVKDWTAVELVVKAAKELELTTKGREHASSDFLFCKFARNGSMDNRQTPQVPFSSSPTWRKEQCPTYKVEYNVQMEHAYSKDHAVDFYLMKGNASVPGEYIKLGKWRETVERIHYCCKDLEEREIEGELSKGEFLLAGSLVVGMKPLEMTKEMLGEKRGEIAKRLGTLLDWIVAFRKETSSSEKSPLHQANISVPIMLNVSLLHAAVQAADLSLVKRLLSLGADPRASSIEGTALDLAVTLESEAENDDGQEAETVFKDIFRALFENVSAASQTTESKMLSVEKADKPTDRPQKIESTSEEPAAAATSIQPHTKRTKDSSERGASASAATTVKSSEQTKASKKKESGVSYLPASMTKGKDNKTPASSTVATTPGPSQASKRPSQAPAQESSKASPIALPHISTKNWLPRKLGMPATRDRLCRYYPRSMCYEGAQCKYCHVHPEVGSILDSAELAPSPSMLQLYVPRDFVRTTSSRNERGTEQFWTAAFCHPKDSVVYYAERGPKSHRSSQGLYWYPDEESAIFAVQMAVYAVVGPKIPPSRKRRREEENYMDRNQREGGESRSRSTSPVPTAEARPNKVSKFEQPKPKFGASQASEDKVLNFEPAVARDSLAPSAQDKPISGMSQASKGQLAESKQPLTKVLNGSPSRDDSITPATKTTSSRPTSDIADSPISDLPLMPDSNWLEGRRRVHPPIGSLLQNDSWCRLAVMEMEGDHPENYAVKEKINDAYQLWYTAAFVDPSNPVVYYAEGGKDGRQGDKGIYWYPTEESAKASAKRVAAAAQKMKRDAAPQNQDEPKSGPPSALVPLPDSDQVPKPGKPGIIYMDSHKDQQAIHEDSSISNTSVDDSESLSADKTPDNSDLPEGIGKLWLENKKILCKFYHPRTKKGCQYGRSCHFAHIHPAIGSSRLKSVVPSRVSAVSDQFIQQKEALTPNFQLFYTAAYLDPKENLIYYAEGGKGAHKSPEELFWYKTEEDAIKAVKRVVAASRDSGQALGPTSTRPSPPGTEQLEDAAILADIKKEPNLQNIFQRIFPGHFMKKTCWNVQHSSDGMVWAAFTPPPGIGFQQTNIGPTRKGGVLRDSRFWYRDEKTAKAACFANFLDLCARRGFTRDARHTLDGHRLF